MSRKKIMVVEDNRMNRMMLCGILTSASIYEVLEAQDGQAALNILKQYGEEISLILLDINMPVMDGYTFLSIVKADPLYASVPVIVTTQSDSESDEVTALSYGATDFVVKPYKPEVILHRMANIINLRETASIVNLLQYDRLTGLYTKEFFYQRVKTFLNQQPDQEYDIICSDIENFKLVNDIFGVPAGDQILRGIADMYVSMVGERGICGRLNSDKFVCLLEHQTQYSQEWFREVSDRINELSSSRNVVMKWGIYSGVDHGLSIEQMCDWALLAAQSIKGQYGRYFAYYDEQLRSRLLLEQAITDSMETALAKGQFKVYLQPKYRIRDTALAGAEALIRWNHPKLGIMSPGQFIPLFEQNGFITKLDQFVWDKACAMLRDWDQKGYPQLSISVNVSRADIYNAELADVLTNLVGKYGLASSRLHLEITESAYTENPKQIIDTVTHLRELGFVIEMDDFGSGYSSLNMINQMPLDVLKLDMKFIQNETAKPVHQGILRFIMGLAGSMDLSVVAEGVETREQLERLSQFGCDYGQGYYFAKPMPYEEFEILLRQFAMKSQNSSKRKMDLQGDHIYADGQRQQRMEAKLVSAGEKQYFQTVIKNLPGGVAVIRIKKDGTIIPEYLSEGFAELTDMTQTEALSFYRQDALMGVHPDDRGRAEKEIVEHIAKDREHFIMEYRIRKGPEKYVWVRTSFSLILGEDGEKCLYAVYHDISKEVEERDSVWQRYDQLLLRHYQKPAPNALLVGHCNITQNQVMEIIDHTGQGLKSRYGIIREEFFIGLSELIVDEKERRDFLGIYSREPALAAFERNDTDQVREYFIQLPNEEIGRYAQVKMSMVETPGSGDVTGILTVVDITERIAAERVLHQLTVSGYDFVADVDLYQDTYQLLSCNKNAHCVPPSRGSHSKWMKHMLDTAIVPRDRENYERGLEPDTMLKRLREENAYTLSFSVVDGKGDIRTKNITVSPIDLRLKRICLSRIDITDSVREQQGLLNMIAYTFDLAGFINIQKGSLIMYTRQTVLENLSPYLVEDYQKSLCRLAEAYGDETSPELREQFLLDTMTRRLEQSPSGYDFVVPYQGEEGLRYKQVNVLWGDHDHRTICLVRMDVTDILMAERTSKKELETALELAEEANRAKSDFLSAMSHDIRTPLNAITGMTELAVAHFDDPQRVMDCLKKISTSSRHLLSLVNDILDVNGLEQSKIKLVRMVVSLPELLERLSSMMMPQAKTAGLKMEIRMQGIAHPYFYGDVLRLNQILLNILGNAVKYTEQGGRVDFLAEEIGAQKKGNVRYRFTVSDTGIGMSQEFLSHMFEPFSRSSNASGIEGSGLGLNIVKGMVDLLGGSIKVESGLGEGTVFVIELEAELAEEEGRQREGREQEAGPAKKPVLAGCRILVAEDNAINAEITCGILEMLGASSVVRADGRQTVQEFKNTEPGTYDAILMDIQMPEMNGYEATRTIRGWGRADAKRIPIIAMTANAFAEDVQASMESGMNAHVSKPIDVEILQDTLRKVIPE